ncbi:hypothetical protein Pelo_19032 [Pelomyxa schiedti]|nr:hypothetical protein Pelo_19032 [Pelomyxa schiedti]
MQERNSLRRQRAQQATITRTQIRVTCHDQLAALLASSHPRCGAASPARHVACVSPLMRHLWAAAVVAPARWFVLAPVIYSEEPSWCVTFAVSPTTLGVLRGPRAAPSNPLSMWLGPRACLALERGTGFDVSSMALGMQITSGTSDGGGVGGVVVAGTTVAVQLPTWFPKPFGRAVLNKVDPDEALLQSRSDDGDGTAYFILVDVPLSHSTQSLQVLSVTKSNFPEGLNFVCAPLILRKSSGDPVFATHSKRDEINLNAHGQACHK